MSELPTKKINELTDASAINESDLVIIQTAGSTPKTQKATISLLLNKIKSWLLTISPFSYLSSVNKNIQTQINDLSNGKAASTHTHDDRYFTESEINNKLSPMSASITSLSNNKLDKSGGLLTGDLTVQKNDCGIFFYNAEKTRGFRLHYNSDNAWFHSYKDGVYPHKTPIAFHIDGNVDIANLTTHSLVGQSSYMRNGWTIRENNAVSYFCLRRLGHMVFINAQFIPGTKTEGVVIANIPSPYRPNDGNEFVHVLCTDTDVTSAVFIRTDGNMNLYGNVGKMSGCIIIKGFWNSNEIL